LTNKRIADRFTDLGRRQIEQVRRWLKSQVADDATTARLERDLDELAQQCDAGQER
jgi:hypothetical protein